MVFFVVELSWFFDLPVSEVLLGYEAWPSP